MEIVGPTRKRRATWDVCGWCLFGVHLIKLPPAPVCVCASIMTQLSSTYLMITLTAMKVYVPPIVWVQAGINIYRLSCVHVNLCFRSTLDRFNYNNPV